MTLVLELPIELETELREGAAARGVAVEDFAVERLRGAGEAVSPQQKRRAAVEAVSGCLKGSDWIVEDFNVDKRADIERENERDLL